MADRRHLLIALGLAGLGIRPGLAQDKKRLPRIGVLFFGSADTARGPSAVITDALRERGLIDGKTASIMNRYSDGSMERLHAHAAEMAREKVDVILATTGTGTEAARRAAPATPIVCASCGDFIGSGFAASLARPGGNITGTSIMSRDLNQKRIQLLKEVAPKLQRMAIVTAPDISRTVAAQDSEVEETGARLGIETRVFMNLGAGSFEELESQLRAWRTDGIFLMGTNLNMLHRKELGDLAMRLKLPLIGVEVRHAEAGALLSYGANQAANYRRAAYFVDRILKGTKPADLPIEQPMRFELVVNMKTAKALGITIPPPILVWTDKVIE